MDPGNLRIFPLGDNAITVEFGNEISEPLNRAAVALAEFFTANPFRGFVEAVPAYSSATFFYRIADVLVDNADKASAFDIVKGTLLNAIGSHPGRGNDPLPPIEIPVRFGPDESLDLASISEQSGLSPEDAVSLFLSGNYYVYMLGFLPGFPYMGSVDERIAVPRRSAPRLNVPKGSVGIAGRQTGIYPSESPGGWQIIGRTDLELLTSDISSPCLLRPGDNVRFIRV